MGGLAAALVAAVAIPMAVTSLGAPIHAQEADEDPFPLRGAVRPGESADPDAAEADSDMGDVPLTPSSSSKKKPGQKTTTTTRATSGARTGPNKGASARAVRPGTAAPRPRPIAGPIQPTVPQPSAARPIQAGVPQPALTPDPRSPLDDPDQVGEIDPFEPQGWRTGAFTILPEVELGVGAATNIAGANPARSGAFFQIAPELKGRSNWSRHALDFDLKGTFTGYPSDSALNGVAGSAALRGRLDVTETARIDLNAGLARTRESATSLNLPAGTTKPVDGTTLSAGAGVSQAFGRLSVNLKGDVSRATYTDGVGDRDTTAVTGTLRVGYEVSPAIQPFVEAKFGRRLYDNAIDANGNRRAAWTSGLRGGIAFDMGPTLKAEVAAGYGLERLDDTVLGELRGATFDATLAWAPTRLTTIRATLATTFTPTTLAGSPGSIDRTASLSLEHDLTRQIALELMGSYTFRDYQNLPTTEEIATASATATYRFTREVGAFARGSVSRTKSTGAAAVDDARILVGVRLTR
jgi:hypothetical protein